MNNDLLTVVETAAMLRLRPSTIRAWVLRRRLAYVKVGRLVRVRRSDVEELIAASLVPARSSETT
jgi:excisionase family DNA binding protein